MKRFSEYIDELCREHKLIRHSDEACHYSDLTSDFQNRLKRTMHYPCVSLDTDGFAIESVNGSKYVRERFNIYFVDHCRDVGNYKEVTGIFVRMRSIADDFLRRMDRDKHNLVDPLTHFNLEGTEGTRIEFHEAALFGWAVTVLVTTPFNNVLCNNIFNS